MLSAVDVAVVPVPLPVRTSIVVMTPRPLLGASYSPEGMPGTPEKYTDNLSVLCAAIARLYLRCQGYDEVTSTQQDEVTKPGGAGSVMLPLYDRLLVFDLKTFVLEGEEEESQ